MVKRPSQRNKKALFIPPSLPPPFGSVTMQHYVSAKAPCKVHTENSAVVTMVNHQPAINRNRPTLHRCTPLNITIQHLHITPHHSTPLFHSTVSPHYTTPQPHPTVLHLHTTPLTHTTIPHHSPIQLPPTSPTSLKQYTSVFIIY